MWAVKCVSSVVSANGVVAGGWMEGSVLVIAVFGFLNTEDGTDRSSRKVSKKLPLLAAK